MFDKVSPRSALLPVCMSVSASIPVESSGRLIIEHVPGREMEGKRQPFQSASLLLSYTPSLSPSLSPSLCFCLLCLVHSCTLKYLCWHFTFWPFGWLCRAPYNECNSGVSFSSSISCHTGETYRGGEALGKMQMDWREIHHVLWWTRNGSSYDFTSQKLFW